MCPELACAIESAAQSNPDWEVIVLFSAKVGFNNITRLVIIDQLASYPNINFRHVNIDSYVKGTPLVVSHWKFILLKIFCCKFS